jgi:maltooligosyltrehalose trehalohydrolase
VDTSSLTLDIGASFINRERVRFKVWAPFSGTVSVEITINKKIRRIRLKKDQMGYFEGFSENVHDGNRYYYLIDDRIRCPDPASRFQPDGVHGPSQVIDPSGFLWDDETWEGFHLKDFIIYELHAGTFTKEGTFESIIPHLDYLKGMGMTAVELMPDRKSVV